MYHNRVTRMPRSVEAIICSTVRNSPCGGPANTILSGASPISLGRAKPWPEGRTGTRVGYGTDDTIFDQLQPLSPHPFAVERNSCLQRVIHVVPDGNVLAE